LTQKQKAETTIFDTLPPVVAIVGSRTFGREDWVRGFVQRLKKGSIVVSGGAKGVDWWAESEAIKQKIRNKIFHVEDFEWQALGKRAGMVRNEVLLTYVKQTGGHVVVFAETEDGALITKGTKNVYESAKRLGIPTTLYTYEVSQRIADALDKE
jgi:hypothetical protein